MLEQLTTSLIFSLLFVFCRVGTSLVLMPGIGEMYVPIRVRLFLGFMISMVILPAIHASIPAMPQNVLNMAVLLISEIMIGLIIGLAARLILNGIHVAGMIIAYQSGLASATLFDVNQGSQGSVIGNLLTLLVVILFFILDLHHLVLMGVMDSYQLFTPGVFPDTADTAQLVTEFVSKSFTLAVQFAAPQIIIGLILYLGAGVMARLMPAMQIFFIIMPLQITISFLVLAATIIAGLMWYMGEMAETLSSFLIGN